MPIPVSVKGGGQWVCANGKGGSRTALTFAHWRRLAAPPPWIPVVTGMTLEGGDTPAAVGLIILGRDHKHDISTTSKEYFHTRMRGAGQTLRKSPECSSLPP